MNIQCSSQQPSAAAPQTVPLFLIDSCMNIQAQTFKIFSGAFGAKCSKFSPAPSAPKFQNFLWRLRRKIFNFFSGAFGAKYLKFSPQTVPLFLIASWMHIQFTSQQPSAAAPQSVPLFLIDSCMHIQFSSQQPSAAAPQTVPLFPLFLIDSCMHIQCSSQQP